jgi:hypothetical protein
MMGAHVHQGEPTMKAILLAVGLVVAMGHAGAADPTPEIHLCLIEAPNLEELAFERDAGVPALPALVAIHDIGGLEQVEHLAGDVSTTASLGDVPDHPLLFVALATQGADEYSRRIRCAVRLEPSRQVSRDAELYSRRRDIWRDQHRVEPDVRLAHGLHSVAIPLLNGARRAAR